MKTLITLSIPFLLLFFTAKSQSITVESNKLCFDSAAAVALYKTIVDRESLAQEVDIYQELYTSYDSLLSAQEKHKLFLQSEVSRLYTESEDTKTRYNASIIDGKKQRKKWFWIGTSTGLGLPLIIMILTR